MHTIGSLRGRHSEQAMCYIYMYMELQVGAPYIAFSLEDELSRLSTNYPNKFISHAVSLTAKLTTIICQLSYHVYWQGISIPTPFISNTTPPANPAECPQHNTIRNVLVTVCSSTTPSIILSNTDL